MKRSLLPSIVACLCTVGCAVSHPKLMVAQDAQEAAPIDWKAQVGDVMGRPGELKDGVYTVTAPRADLDVKIEGMSVPTAAGIFSTFRFYRCTCGKISVLGEIVCVDFEANDVIESLHVGSAIQLAGMGPIALGEKPRLLSIRFHGEGEGPDLAKRIKAALRWTGEERSPPIQPLK